MHNQDSTDKNRQAANDSATDEADLRYERLDKLGEGTYGIVYKSRDRETNEVRILTLCEFHDASFNGERLKNAKSSLSI